MKIGANLSGGRCEFRVWAPNAERVVLLLKSGNDWNVGTSLGSHPMTRENGYWPCGVSGTAPGTLYRYAITHAGETFQRLDPAAKDVLHSGLTRRNPTSDNAAIVVDASAFSWTDFQTPAFEDYIIYQFHVGSFAGRNDGLDREIATFADVQTKLSHIASLGFTAIQPLPIQEFAFNRAWGYDTFSYFAVESAYGAPDDLRRLVDAAYQAGLAVIFDVVYNHAGGTDNVLWQYDGDTDGGGIYFQGGWQTHWGKGPAWWKEEVRDFFYQNAKTLLDEYQADGLRFDATRAIDGTQLAMVLKRLREEYPNRYFIAEHLPQHPWIVTDGGFCATWHDAHHDLQRALAGDRPIDRVLGFLGWDGYPASWNLVKYLTGSHDDCGDLQGGTAEDGLQNWDRRHRYLVDQFGGRYNWWARAKCRLAWALNAATPGTPMLFTGTECHMGSPNVGWGYWHDGPDQNGDHRFDWSIAGDSIGMSMRRLVAAANWARRDNEALRKGGYNPCHIDRDNQVLAFRRSTNDNLVLVVVNLSDRSFADHSYGVQRHDAYVRWVGSRNWLEAAMIVPRDRQQHVTLLMANRMITCGGADIIIAHALGDLDGDGLVDLAVLANPCACSCCECAFDGLTADLYVTRERSWLVSRAWPLVAMCWSCCMPPPDVGQSQAAENLPGAQPPPVPADVRCGCGPPMR